VTFSFGVCCPKLDSTIFVVPLGFLLQCVVEVMLNKYPSPKESYFQSQLKSIYDAESMQN
jgi:hypothetical protein